MILILRWRIAQAFDWFDVHVLDHRYTWICSFIYDLWPDEYANDEEEKDNDDD